jgi:hypothetical protein
MSWEHELSVKNIHGGELRAELASLLAEQAPPPERAAVLAVALERAALISLSAKAGTAKVLVQSNEEGAVQVTVLSGSEGETRADATGISAEEAKRISAPKPVLVKPPAAPAPAVKPAVKPAGQLMKSPLGRGVPPRRR